MKGTVAAMIATARITRAIGIGTYMISGRVDMIHRQPGMHIGGQRHPVTENGHDEPDDGQTTKHA